ncbi:MAG: hypothetical protein NT079_03880 [Candidatus Omnitrophica bacterium]|nr:hypothetical protein [Candidatus Omnitrophota bacterium]
MKKYIAPIILFFFAAGLMVVVSPLIAQDAGFVYNDNGRRDPFWALVSSNGKVLVYDEGVEFSDMTLEGIIYDPKGERLAIINSKIVKASDNIGGFSVYSVDQDSVVLRKDGKDFILKLKRGDYDSTIFATAGRRAQTSPCASASADDGSP